MLDVQPRVPLSAPVIGGTKDGRYVNSWSGQSPRSNKYVGSGVPQLLSPPHRVVKMETEVTRLEERLRKERVKRDYLEDVCCIADAPPLPSYPFDYETHVEERLQQEVNWLRCELSAMLRQLSLLELRSINSKRQLEEDVAVLRVLKETAHFRERYQDLRDQQELYETELTFMMECLDLERLQNQELEQMLVRDGIPLPSGEDSDGLVLSDTDDSEDDEDMQFQKPNWSRSAQGQSTCASDQAETRGGGSLQGWERQQPPPGCSGEGSGRGWDEHVARGGPGPNFGCARVESMRESHPPNKEAHRSSPQTLPQPTLQQCGPPSLARANHEPPPLVDCTNPGSSTKQLPTPSALHEQVAEALHRQGLFQKLTLSPPIAAAFAHDASGRNPTPKLTQLLNLRKASRAAAEVDKRTKVHATQDNLPPAGPPMRLEGGAALREGPPDGPDWGTGGQGQLSGQAAQAKEVTGASDGVTLALSGVTAGLGSQLYTGGGGVGEEKEREQPGGSARSPLTAAGLFSNPHSAEQPSTAAPSTGGSLVTSPERGVAAAGAAPAGVTAGETRECATAGGMRESGESASKEASREGSLGKTETAMASSHTRLRTEDSEVDRQRGKPRGQRDGSILSWPMSQLHGAGKEAACPSAPQGATLVAASATAGAELATCEAAAPTVARDVAAGEAGPVNAVALSRDILCQLVAMYRTAAAVCAESAPLESQEFPYRVAHSTSSVLPGSGSLVVGRSTSASSSMSPLRREGFLTDVLSPGSSPIPGSGPLSGGGGGSSTPPHTGSGRSPWHLRRGVLSYSGPPTLFSSNSRVASNLGRKGGAAGAGTGGGGSEGLAASPVRKAGGGGFHRLGSLLSLQRTRSGPAGFEQALESFHAEIALISSPSTSSEEGASSSPASTSPCRHVQSPLHHEGAREQGQSRFSLGVIVDPMENRVMKKWISDPYKVLAEHPCPSVGPYFKFAELLAVPCWGRAHDGAARRYSALVGSLRHVDPSRLARRERVAFWINIYNALVMHAYMLEGVPSSYSQLVAMQAEATFCMNGQQINALEVEHAILRCHSPCPTASAPGLQWPRVGGFAASDLRASWPLTEHDPYVSFALCAGTLSSPALRVYTAEGVADQLEAAKDEYLRAAIGIGGDGRIILPKMLEWYGRDFAASELLVLDWIAKQLPAPQRLAMEECMPRDRDLCVEVVPYSWGFRYLLEPTVFALS